LKYLFGLKNIQIGHNFGGIFINDSLKKDIITKIADVKYKNNLEKIYSYLKRNRHIIFHTEQVLPSTVILGSKKEADSIVNEVINLIETTYFDISN
jgi:hypothetical protein